MMRSRKDLKIVYTPLHGTGNIPARRILKSFERGGTSPTVSYPRGMSLNGLKLAKEIDADIVLAKAGSACV